MTAIAAGVLAILSFVVAAVVAETSLNPPFRRRASDTAALAQSVAHAVDGSASGITLRAGDGVALRAWWLRPRAPNGRTVLACHGVADSGFGVMADALLFLRNGYSVLVPDSRGHGESGGFVSYGALESGDVLQWLAWLRGQGNTEIFGFGESLGGAILLQSLGRGAAFRAVIAESSYASFEQVADERVSKYGRVPRWLAFILVKEALLYVRLRHGVALWTVQPETAVRNTRVPVLLIHGLNDDETLPVHSREIAAQDPNAELWLVEGAGHTGAWAAAPAEFERRVLAFFARVPASQ